MRVRVPLETARPSSNWLRPGHLLTMVHFPNASGELLMSFGWLIRRNEREKISHFPLPTIPQELDFRARRISWRFGMYSLPSILQEQTPFLYQSRLNASLLK